MLIAKGRNPHNGRASYWAEGTELRMFGGKMPRDLLDRAKAEAFRRRIPFIALLAEGLALVTPDKIDIVIRRGGRKRAQHAAQHAS